MPHYRKIRDYEPRSYILLVIDVLTLVPMNGIYYLFCYVNGETDMMNQYFMRAIRTKSLIRLYRVYLYSVKIKDQAGRNQMFVIWLGHLVLVALFVHGFGALWYYMSCYKCERLNWAMFLEDHQFDSKSILEWFIICISNIGIVLEHCYRGH